MDVRIAAMLERGVGVAVHDTTNERHEDRKVRRGATMMVDGDGKDREETGDVTSGCDIRGSEGVCYVCCWKSGCEEGEI